MFEFQDEWWKEAERQPETWSSHDTTIEKSEFPFGEPGSGFASYWDEEWFGLMSVATSSARRPDSPVLLDRRARPGMAERRRRRADAARGILRAAGRLQRYQRGSGANSQSSESHSDIISAGRE